MKNSLFLATALFVASVASAQTPDSTQKPAPVVDSTQKQQPLTSGTTTMADTSINAAYIADREALRGLKTEDIRPEHAFPVLGSFTASGNSTDNVTIVPDSANKGIVWVEGLSQGRFKALLKKAPATYKIPAQKTESGKTVAEGTLFYNPASRELTIVLGRAFNDADPAAALAASGKQKTKAWQYTGTKTGAVAPAVPQQ